MVVPASGVANRLFIVISCKWFLYRAEKNNDLYSEIALAIFVHLVQSCVMNRDGEGDFFQKI
jgi:hypothetical protein